MADLLLSKQELKAKFSRKYNYKQAKCKDPKIIKGWFSLIQNTVAKYSILEQDIYNFDKVGFAIGVIATTKIGTSTVHYFQGTESPLYIVQGLRIARQL
ncbi:hypothetical protein V496_00945, partial [Pseudogymnoascus sp. VKM F-4515 (FW-2607)]